MNTLVSLNSSLQCRTVFISDVHLGFHGCSADFLNGLSGPGAVRVAVRFLNGMTLAP